MRSYEDIVAENPFGQIDAQQSDPTQVSSLFCHGKLYVTLLWKIQLESCGRVRKDNLSETNNHFEICIKHFLTGMHHVIIFISEKK